MYVDTLKLKPTKQQCHELNKRFRQATDIYRATLHEILKRVRKLIGLQVQKYLIQRLPQFPNQKRSKLS